MIANVYRALRVHRPCQRLYIAVAVVMTLERSASQVSVCTVRSSAAMRFDLITPQPPMLPLDHRDLDDCVCVNAVLNQRVAK